jgi:hypothetical protein
MAWYDTDGPPGAGCTLNHHSLDPYGGHGMVQQQLIRCLGWSCNVIHYKFLFGIAGTLLKFDPHFQFKTWHGVTQMGHQELVAHWIITHWIHMEDMEWFSSNW